MLAGAIAQHTLIAVSRAHSETMVVSSAGFTDTPIHLDAQSLRSGSQHSPSGAVQWFDYAAAVVAELNIAGVEVPGFEMTITSTVPSSGGVSSSASFELGVGRALCELAGHEILLEDLARLCQRAEHAIGSMCGLLDQFAVALGQQGSLLKLDFADDSSQVVKGDLGSNSFVVIFDPSLSRKLGETGYLVRRQACEEGLAAINKVSSNEFSSLRQVSLEWLQDNREAIESAHSGQGSALSSEVVYRRLHHVVSEMQRVDEAVKALSNNNPEEFGRLMTESGKSALEDYELDEGTPELTFIVEQGRDLPGVLGMRNMGGGFSSVSLALIENAAIVDYEDAMNESYSQKFGTELSFVVFEPSGGVEVL